MGICHRDDNSLPEVSGLRYPVMSYHHHSQLGVGGLISVSLYRRTGGSGLVQGEAV